CFFFSSRRRHTRFSRDWSSDVCSSDLHGDHTFGLPGLLASASMAGRTEPLTIVAPAPLATFIRSALEITQSWLTFELQFVDVAEHGFTWQDDTIRVAVAELSHRVPCFAYVV